MDKIILKDLEVFAHHGVLQSEKDNGQLFFIDCECDMSTRRAGQTDNLDYALDYSELAQRLNQYFTEKQFDLIEAAAEYCAENILLDYPLVSAVTLTIKKPSAPIDQKLAYPAVSICRQWHSAVLTLGSNIEPRQEHMDNAVFSLAAHPQIRLMKTSAFIETDPVGYEDQPRFLNGAVLVDTLLTPQELLKAVNDIEDSEGRERTIHWGPRTLDIDIIYYDDLLLSTKKLTIPHPLCLERSFVTEPIMEIDPYRIDPRYGQTVSTLINKN